MMLGSRVSNNTKIFLFDFTYWPKDSSEQLHYSFVLLSNEKKKDTPNANQVPKKTPPK